MTSNGAQNGDRQPRLYCNPYSGARSPEFLPWKRDFETGADAHFLHEDDYSIWEACTDNDQGSASVPLPGQAQAGHLNAVRRMKKRQNVAFERIYAHVDNQRLRDMFAAIPAGNRRGAAAWQTLVAECGFGTTDLFILDLKKEYENATIDKDVGHHAETITDFNRLLLAINAKMPVNAKISDSDLCVKVLSNITYPDALALEAVTELNAVAGSRRFEKVVNGNPVRDLDALVRHLDAVWRGLKPYGYIFSLLTRLH